MNTRIFILSAVLGAGVFVGGSTAMASHYFVADLGDVFSEVQLEAFARYNIEDTEHVLLWLRDPDTRYSFGFSTGFTQEELLNLTVYCDLLQVDGIGPSVASLLMAVGVGGAADLTNRGSASLLAEIQVVNLTENYVTTLPDEAHVQSWIDAATEVPHHIVY